jgi:signal transduction histidine kinase
VIADAAQISDRLDRLGRLLSLPLLAAALLLAWFTARGGYGTAEQFRAALVVCGVAAAWCAVLGLSLRWRSNPARVLLFTGQFVLGAVLVGLNPWFGIFAFLGYMLADELPGRWVLAGCIANAFVISGSEVGGYPFVSHSSWLAYLIVAGVSVTIVIGLVLGTNAVSEQNKQRGRVIAELNEANERLAVALKENAGLHAQLLEQAREAGAQDERTRLAGEIHDTLAQTLTGIVTQLEAAGRVSGDAQRRHLDQAQGLARSGLREARRSVRALRPEQLEHADLTAAIGELADEWTRSSGLPVRVEATGTVRPLPAATEDAVFRVAQEALTNVAKHAQASTVWLTLTYLDDVLLLDVRDDGTGWNGAARDGGFGLDGMRTRLSRVGGALAIESAPGDGTAISASVPAERPARHDPPRTLAGTPRT